MEDFGTLGDGRTVHRLTLGTGPLKASILTWGANLQDVRLDGVAHSLTMGSPALTPYEGGLASAGGLIGPVVNRISGAQATLDGTTHHLEERPGTGMTLHSGSAGTHRVLWDLIDHGPDHATLRTRMPAGEAGFPGTRTTTARYEVDGTALTLTARTTTDAPTWINFANHSYWNLDGTETTDGHRLTVHADRYLTADEEGLVDGGISEVEGLLDFREGRVIRRSDDGHLDNNLCVSDGQRPLTEVAVLQGTSGTKMRMATTEPGLQVYDGWKLSDVGAADHQGRPIAPHRGLALEAQGWPDAPSHDHFPSIRLDPGGTRIQVTRWTFDR